MNALGMVELNSTPRGISAADAMLKAADVSVTTAQAVCPGKYIAVVVGSVSAVKASVEAGIAASGERLIDSIVIPNVHEQVASAIAACTELSALGAIGIIETFSLCSAVICADTAAKAADITLLDVRLGRGLGGKSYVLLTGDVAAAEAAVKAAISSPEAEGMINDSVVIPSPHAELMPTII